MKPILVTSYIDPDLDGTAGALAYAEYLNKTSREAVACFLGLKQIEADYVLKRFNIKEPITIEDAKDFQQIILVDASHLSFFEGKIQVERVIEVIDHRKVNEAEKFINAKVQIELVGSACTLVAEKFMENKITVSKESAILMASAIISNTLNFQSNNVTDRDKIAYEWLNKIAGLGDMYWRELFLAKSDVSGEKLNERIVSDFANFTIGGKEFGIAQIEMIGARELVDKRQGEIENILNRIKLEMKLDYVFINILELENHEKFIIAMDQDIKDLLEKVLSGNFVGNFMIDKKKIMRKQAVSMLKDYLEK